jgi:hypothetical protein
MTLLEQTTYSKLCLRSLGLRLNYLKLANLHLVLRIPPLDCCGARRTGDSPALPGVHVLNGVFAWRSLRAQEIRQRCGQLCRITTPLVHLTLVFL